MTRLKTLIHTATSPHTDDEAETTIFYKPHCSTSREALALMQERGLQPQIVEYLKLPSVRTPLERSIAASGRPVADFVRCKKALLGELDLGASSASDAQRIDALLAHPRLLEPPHHRYSAGRPPRQASGVDSGSAASVAMNRYTVPLHPHALLFG